MITCPKCAKENQDHYKFCLGCGAELPRDGSAKKGGGTPPHGVAAARPVTDEPTTHGMPGTAHPVRPRSVPPEAGAPAGAAAAGGGAVVCPQCSHPNPGSNKFCASCGFKLGKAPSVSPPIAQGPAPGAMAAGGGGPVVVLTALRADGSEAGSFQLPPGVVTVGRDTGSVFAGDSYLSPKHATFTPRGGKIYVRDESSLNGVYRKLHREQPVPVKFGDVFRIGQEIIRIEPLQPLPPSPDGVERMGSPARGYVGRIALIIGRDTTGNAYPIPETGLHLGRERGDVLFPEDGYVSGLHCRVALSSGQLYLTDLGSSNGSFLRLSAETEIVGGDILLMGQQLFRVSLSA